MMKQAQPPLRKLVRRDQGTSDLDPAKLGATLRELAWRAHQLVRAIDRSGPGMNNSEQELKEVHCPDCSSATEPGLASISRTGDLRRRPERAGRRMSGLKPRRLIAHTPRCETSPDSIS